ncbi:hypothetical protein [Azospirillum sp. SYSU D00513]|uniref:hypothetical protein n=1 Tax=Azospirillum sp. SYSU D00513 TaxID=2812561 RepID=UPI001A96693A|nr:hypothetical protein [Azospirillum sp. SYSU D00513]
MADRDTSGTGETNKGSEPMGKAREYKDQVTSGINQAQQQAMDAGREQVGAAQTRIRSLLEQQTHRAADQLGSVADALHVAADQLAKENNGAAAHYADQAASRVEQVADMLRDSTMDDIVGQVEGFARRQPEVFIGAAFAVGFLFSRFIKSSGERRMQNSYGSGVRRGQNSYDTGSQTVRNGGYGLHDYDSHGYTESGARAFATGTRARGTGTGTAAGGREMSEGVAASRGTGTHGGTHMGTGGVGGGMGGGARMNSATAATASARSQDAAGLMAGTAPTPKAAESVAKPAGTVPGATLNSSPATGGKPQGTTP